MTAAQDLPYGFSPDSAAVEFGDHYDSLQLEDDDYALGDDDLVDASLDLDAGDGSLAASSAAPKKGKRSNNRKGPHNADKRANHNAVERKRRESLNGRFIDLARALPTMSHIKRPSKAVIVSKALDFVYDSAAREHTLIKENNELRCEVDQLRARLGMPALPPPNPLPDRKMATQATLRKTKKMTMQPPASFASVVKQEDQPVPHFAAAASASPPAPVAPSPSSSVAGHPSPSSSITSSAAPSTLFDSMISPHHAGSVPAYHPSMYSASPDLTGSPAEVRAASSHGLPPAASVQFPSTLLPPTTSAHNPHAYAAAAMLNPTLMHAHLASMLGWSAAATGAPAFNPQLLAAAVQQQQQAFAAGATLGPAPSAVELGLPYATQQQQQSGTSLFAFAGSPVDGVSY
ncbi:hypothetical protein Rhopal_000341-T1 [Rhodotorula paludigena]|uniref:BHLH domain-containing protein n=1 Tax=Rhodotorula paludigena TaxID=86838 RepID=A0AAV5GDH3_9BASI|nr:hypothetical protein Rhopal_000341-T1 [Rhodotorula paludigena]